MSEEINHNPIHNLLPTNTPKDPDMTGLTRNGPEQSGHSRPLANGVANSSYTFTVSEAAAIFSQANIPRNKRSIRRYCDRGDLDCKKSENANHIPQYFIDPNSIDTYIEQQKQLLMASGQFSENFTETQKATEPSFTMNSSIDRLTGPTAQNNKTIVTLLEDQNADLKQQVNRDAEQLQRKDEQIAKLNQTMDSLVERNKETNILLAQLHQTLGTKQINPDYGNEEISKL